jgi:hypothetical protein
MAEQKSATTMELTREQQWHVRPGDKAVLEDGRVLTVTKGPVCDTVYLCIQLSDGCNYYNGEHAETDLRIVQLIPDRTPSNATHPD